MADRSLLIHAWAVYKFGDDYFLPYTHWVYLKELKGIFVEICLLSPTRSISDRDTGKYVCIGDLETVYVRELPSSSSYISTVKFFFKYVEVYKNLPNFCTVYARYPVPFGWLQKVFCRSSHRIIHFVGDPIDVARANPNFGWLKRNLLITFFIPEHLMYMWACRGAKVFTNGFHLADRLKKYRIDAIPLISSTLVQSDFYLNSEKYIDINNPKLIYVGYLREAKGVETVIEAFQMVQKKFPGSQLSIVGGGEFEKELHRLVAASSIKNVTFFGHVDDRSKINQLLRDHDIFCFGSLSEGSPRVILEAMASGINVVSTPVGSLPRVFKEGVDISFADFSDAEAFSVKIVELIQDKEKASRMRKAAFLKVKEFTLTNFIKTIFNEN